MSFSRPIFDPLDDDEDDRPSSRGEREPDDADTDEDAEDDDACVAARLDDEAREALDPSLRAGQARLEEDEDDDLLEAAFPLGDGVADMTATVWCPYCGEPSEVAIDPGGGAAQEYVEDCAVCCQPWRVTVAYGADGSASVSAETTDE